MVLTNSVFSSCVFRSLSDLDKDSQLNIEEFALAMYFVDMAKLGKQLPNHVPQDLLPLAYQGRAHSDSVGSEGRDRSGSNVSLDGRSRSGSMADDKRTICKCIMYNPVKNLLHQERDLIKVQELNLRPQHYCLLLLSACCCCLLITGEAVFCRQQPQPFPKLHGPVLLYVVWMMSGALLS